MYIIELCHSLKGSTGRRYRLNCNGVTLKRRWLSEGLRTHNRSCRHEKGEEGRRFFHWAKRQFSSPISEREIESRPEFRMGKTPIGSKCVWGGRQPSHCG